MPEKDPVCFTCGHPVAESPFENRLDDGSACPTCRDRLLDGAPTLLPAEPALEPEEADAAIFDPYDDDPIGA